ncbi:MAG: cupin domain-containing protein [Candidatus Geothermarchaeales archaeon]
MYTINTKEVKEEPLTKGDAQRVTVKYLIDESHGSEKFYLREYSVAPGGHTRLDKHVYEHQVYILRGGGMMREGSEPNVRMRRVEPGDAIFIPSNQVHQFLNTTDEPLVFLCLKGAENLYVTQSSEMGGK